MCRGFGHNMTGYCCYSWLDHTSGRKCRPSTSPQVPGPVQAQSSVPGPALSPTPSTGPVLSPRPSTVLSSAVPRHDSAASTAMPRFMHLQCRDTPGPGLAVFPKQTQGSLDLIAGPTASTITTACVHMSARSESKWCMHLHCVHCRFRQIQGRYNCMRYIQAPSSILTTARAWWGGSAWHRALQVLSRVCHGHLRSSLNPPI